MPIDSTTGPALIAGTITNLQSTSATPADLAPLMPALAENGSLQAIDFTPNPSLGDAGVLMLVDALMANTKLRGLVVTLQLTNMTDIGANAIATLIKVKPDLFSFLQLDQNRLTDASGVNITNAIGSSSGLQWVTLGFCQLGNATASGFARALASPQCGLVGFDLTANRVGNPGAQDILAALPTNTLCQYAILDRNVVSPSLLSSIATYTNRNIGCAANAFTCPVIKTQTCSVSPVVDSYTQIIPSVFSMVDVATNLPFPVSALTVFTVQNVSGGYFCLNGSSVPLTNFTQAQLNLGQIFFRYTDFQQNLPSFTLTGSYNRTFFTVALTAGTVNFTVTPIATTTPLITTPLTTQQPSSLAATNPITNATVASTAQQSTAAVTNATSQLTSATIALTQAVTNATVASTSTSTSTTVVIDATTVLTQALTNATTTLTQAATTLTTTVQVSATTTAQTQSLTDATTGLTQALTHATTALTQAATTLATTTVQISTTAATSAIQALTTDSTALTQAMTSATTAVTQALSATNASTQALTSATTAAAQALTTATTALTQVLTNATVATTSASITQSLTNATRALTNATTVATSALSSATATTNTIVVTATAQRSSAATHATAGVTAALNASAVPTTHVPTVSMSLSLSGNQTVVPTPAANSSGNFSGEAPVASASGAIVPLVAIVAGAAGGGLVLAVLILLIILYRVRHNNQIRDGKPAKPGNITLALEPLNDCSEDDDPEQQALTWGRMTQPAGDYAAAYSAVNEQTNYEECGLSDDGHYLVPERLKPGENEYDSALVPGENPVYALGQESAGATYSSVTPLKKRGVTVVALEPFYDTGAADSADGPQLANGVNGAYGATAAPIYALGQANEMYSSVTPVNRKGIKAAAPQPLYDSGAAVEEPGDEPQQLYDNANGREVRDNDVYAAVTVVRANINNPLYDTGDASDEHDSAQGDHQSGYLDIAPTGSGTGSDADGSPKARQKPEVAKGGANGWPGKGNLPVGPNSLFSASNKRRGASSAKNKKASPLQHTASPYPTHVLSK